MPKIIENYELQQLVKLLFPFGFVGDCHKLVQYNCVIENRY